MSQMEDIFMAGFFGELDGEEKVAEEVFFAGFDQGLGKEAGLPSALKKGLSKATKKGIDIAGKVPGGAYGEHRALAHSWGRGVKGSGGEMKKTLAGHGKWQKGEAKKMLAKKAAEEMPVLGKALTNLGLLEEEEEMPILKKAMENLGLLDETEGPRSMLEALAQAYGEDVLDEREAMEKDAKVSEAVRGLLSRYTGGMKEFGSGARRLASSYRRKKGKPGKRLPRPKGAALAKMRGKAKKQLKKGAPAAAGTLATGAGGVGLAALLGRKKKKKGKK